ncbi:MAG: HelD family protein [Suipraeoptans sp.]
MAVDFPEEIEHLAIVENKLRNALVSLEEDVRSREKEYMKAKKYLADNWNEIDTMERFSNEKSLSEIENAGNMSLSRKAKIEKLTKTPYFARIDFKYENEDESMQVYIGQFSFTDNNNHILVYDWRAPISSMYYDYELGEASYEAPIGDIKGDIVLKRQFKISEGKMEYALESAINIGDDVLQRELSSTSDEKMKSIIATLQKEQNTIIRNDKSNNLIIQGVAGSGKTSIALHRVAYMLYKFKNELTASNIVIISPNKVFADYISNVLPELGEEPICELSFEDIATSELSGTIKYKKCNMEMDNLSDEWIKRCRFKSIPEFVDVIDDYLEYADNNYFNATDCTFGEFDIKRDYIIGRYKAYKKHLVYKRFDEMTNEIIEKFKTENVRGYKLPSKGEIIKKLASMFKINNTLALYSGFYTFIGKPELFFFDNSNKLEWIDVYPYLYFKMYLEGISGYETVQHLVIDEMQDYTPIQYALINRMFKCKKTILGDFGQSVNPCIDNSVDMFKNIFNNVDIVELNKSYRSTYEIIEFAKRIQNNQNIEPVKRHGEDPKIFSCDSQKAELANIKEKVSQFLSGDYATLGILCKNMETAKKLYKELSKEYPINMLDTDSTKFNNGVIITTILMSKGLEFDEVIIPYADTSTYYTKHDRSLLYVACTRAMHKLSIIYKGTLTELIGEYR